MRLAVRAPLPRPVRRLRGRRPRGLVARGRVWSPLVEQDRRTATLISANARGLGFTRAHVVAVPVATTLLRPPSAPYDVVFLDPPYAHPSSSRRRRPGRAARPRLAGAGRDGRRRARLASRRAAVARGLRRAAGRRSTARPMLWYVHAAHLNRTQPVSPTDPEEAPCAAPSAPGRSTRSPTGTSTSSSGPPSLFDEVVVAVGVNQSKHRLFTADERHRHAASSGRPPARTCPSRASPACSPRSAPSATSTRS